MSVVNHSCLSTCCPSWQVRRLPEIESFLDGPLIIAPGQQVAVDVYVTPRYYGVLRTLVVLDFGVLIARELRVGCSPEGFAGINLGPSAPFTGPQRVQLAPQVTGCRASRTAGGCQQQQHPTSPALLPAAACPPLTLLLVNTCMMLQDAPFEPGVKPPKARTIWLKPPRQWKVPDRCGDSCAVHLMEQLALLLMFLHRASCSPLDSVRACCAAVMASGCGGWCLRGVRRRCRTSWTSSGARLTLPATSARCVLRVVCQPCSSRGGQSACACPARLQTCSLTAAFWTAVPPPHAAAPPAAP
jgi:hypothetical protein